MQRGLDFQEFSLLAFKVWIQATDTKKQMVRDKFCKLQGQIMSD